MVFIGGTTRQRNRSPATAIVPSRIVASASPCESITSWSSWFPISVSMIELKVTFGSSGVLAPLGL